MPSLIIILLLGALSTCQTANAKTFELRPGIPIQKVINKVKDGDTIKLKQGKYKVNLIIKKNIRIIGEGPGVILEQEKASAPIVTIDNNSRALLERLVFQNSRPTKTLFAMYSSFPSVISIRNSCPTLKYVTLINNIYFDQESAVEVVGKCKENNHARFFNSAFLYNRSESATGQDSFALKIAGNSSVINCSFIKNDGGIKVNDTAKSVIIRNIFYDNGKKYQRLASRAGFGEALLFSENEEVILRENLFIDNSSGALAFVYGKKNKIFKTIAEAQEELPNITEFNGSIALNRDGKTDKKRFQKVVREIKLQLKGRNIVVNTGARDPEVFGGDPRKIPGVLGGKNPHPDFQ